MNTIFTINLVQISKYPKAKIFINPRLKNIKIYFQQVQKSDI